MLMCFYCLVHGSWFIVHGSFGGLVFDVLVFTNNNALRTITHSQFSTMDY